MEEGNSRVSGQGENPSESAPLLREDEEQFNPPVAPESGNSFCVETLLITIDEWKKGPKNY